MLAPRRPEVYDTAQVKAAVPHGPAFAAMLGLRPSFTAGDRCRVLCPWHQEKSPACAVWGHGAQLRAYCHACHEGGDAYALAGAVWEESRFVSVKERLAALLGVPECARGSMPPPAPRRTLAAEYVLAIGEMIERMMCGRDNARATDRAEAILGRMTARDRAEASRMLFQR